MRWSRRTSVLMLVAMMSLIVTSCGDDDDDTAGSASPQDAAGDVDEYCATALKLETIPDPDIDFESLSPEQQKEEAKKYVAEEVLPLVNEIEGQVPEEAEADARVLIDAVRELGRTGDFEAFENDPAVQAAEQDLHGFDLQNCGWESSDVTGIDYAYEGLRTELSAGPHSFDFTNSGEEMHMLGIVKKNEDVTESFDQLLELPEDEAERKTTFLGEAFAPPGESDYVVVDLEPGEYLAICFIPVGATPDAEQSGQEPQGPPHFTRGMKTEFTVS